MKFLFIFFMALNVLHAECNVDKKIILSILMSEAPEKKYGYDLGYEYFISFNNPSDADKARTVYKDLFFNSRTIDCKNTSTCIKIVNHLIDNKITNLDLGAYSINLEIHQGLNAGYFDLDKSYEFACDYTENNIRRFIGRGFWYAVACYHSGTPSLNKKYQQRLKRHYEYLSSIF